MTIISALDSFFRFSNNYLIPFVIGLAVLVLIFALFKYVTAGGDESKLKEARNVIIVGVIVIAVMISVWGLINLVVNTFGLDDSGLSGGNSYPTI